MDGRFLLVWSSEYRGRVERCPAALSWPHEGRDTHSSETHGPWVSRFLSYPFPRPPSGTNSQGTLMFPHPIPPLQSQVSSDLGPIPSSVPGPESVCGNT